jgi:hypothetical protein
LSSTLDLVQQIALSSLVRHWTDKGQNVLSVTELIDLGDKYLYGVGGMTVADENLSHCHFCHHNSHMNSLGANLGFRGTGERVTT